MYKNGAKVRFRTRGMGAIGTSDTIMLGMDNVDDAQMVKSKEVQSPARSYLLHLSSGAATVLDVGGSRLRHSVGRSRSNPYYGSSIQDKEKLQQDFDAVARDMKTVVQRQSRYLTKHS